MSDETKTAESADRRDEIHNAVAAEVAKGLEAGFACLRDEMKADPSKYLMAHATPEEGESRKSWEDRQERNDFIRSVLMPEVMEARGVNPGALIKSVQEKALGDIEKDHGPEYAKQMATDPGSAGGFLVPTTTAAEILTESENFSPFAQMVRVFDGIKHKIEIPRSLAKPTASYRGENTAIPKQQATFSQTSLEPVSLAVIVDITEELIQDSAVDIESWINLIMAEAIGLKRQERMAIGAGTAGLDPLGIENMGFGSIAQTASALDYSTVLALYLELEQQYRNGAAFVGNSSAQLALMNVLDGEGRPIFTMPSGNGRPQVFNADFVELPDLTGDANGGTTTLFFGQWRSAVIHGRSQELRFKRTDMGDTTFCDNLVWLKATTRDDTNEGITRAAKKLTGVTTGTIGS